MCEPDSFDYEPAEYDFDDNEPEGLAGQEEIHEEGYAIVNGEGQPVQPGMDVDGAGASGDPNAAAAQSKVMLQQREKKVANEKRTTTPYMTKYERARVLGTRALQIRCVIPSPRFNSTICHIGGYKIPNNSL